MTEERDNLRREVEKLRKEVEELKTESSSNKEISEQDFSRRGFMKALGAGAVGMSAIAMSGKASALEILGPNGFAYGNSEGDKFQVDSEGKVEAKDISGDVFAAHFEGQGLASKVKNALNYIKQERSGRGRIQITPKNDGTEWVWDKELRIDPTKYEGLEIIVQNSVEIDYPGTGWAIHVKTTWEDRSQRGIKIIGGKWSSSGEAEGWLRSDDTYRCQYAPDEVVFESPNSTGIQIRNIDGWSEEYVIGGIGSGHIKAGTGIELLGSSETGGSGTDSHHGGMIKDMAAVKGDRYSIKVQCTFQYGGIYNTTLRPRSDNTQMLLLDPPPSNEGIGRLDGLLIMNCKWEDAGGSVDGNSQGTKVGEVGVRLGENYDNFYGPMAIANHAWIDELGSAHQDARNPEFLNLKMQNGYKVRDWISGDQRDIQTN